MSKTLTTKNGSITLPKKLGRKWSNVSVFIVPSKDTLVIKKMQKPLGRLSDIARKNTSRRMSRRTIERQIRAYRRSA